MPQLDLRDALDLAGVLVTAILGVVAVAAYLRDVEHKRTDWLYGLFEKFYEKPTYKRIRGILDGPDAAQLLNLLVVRSDECTSDQRQLVDAFCDYLNFFEFMCNLVEKRRMDRDDLNRQFDYYLSNLAQPGIVKYASENGYEALARELARRS